MLMLQTKEYMPDETVKEANSINQARERLGQCLQQNEAVASEILTAENATAKTVERKAKARFKRVGILKNLLLETDRALPWLKKAGGAWVAEYDRLTVKEQPPVHAEIKRDLVSIGFSENFAESHAEDHPRAVAICTAIQDVLAMQHAAYNVWLQTLQAERGDLDKQLQDAVRRIS